jgi:serine/threonine protein kinase
MYYVVLILLYIKYAILSPIDACFSMKWMYIALTTNTSHPYIHICIYNECMLTMYFRRNILVGIASGLQYLHTDCRDAILHRDIKPANVMLDRNFNAILADFGLVTELSHTQTSHPTDNVIGTLSYIDPAYKETGKASGLSDVYSLGVMLLEIVCGTKPTIQADGKNSLIEKVRQCKAGSGDNSILQAADRGIRGEFDEEIKIVLELGLSCVRTDRTKRPHTGRVRYILHHLAGVLRSASANGTAASTSHNHQPSEDVFGTCSEMFPTHSPGDEEAGVSPLLNSN